MPARHMLLAGGTILGVAWLARAGGNDPEKAAARAQEYLVPKVSFLCDVPLSISYDGDSLRKHDPVVAHDQTDGENECNEPLRYLWYACKTAAGKGAVKAARLSKIVCRGVPGKAGTLALVNGTLTAGRAADEANAFVRSRKEFEALLKVRLELPVEDPYQDEKWRAVLGEPNPVTNRTSYCTVDGEKVELARNGGDPWGYGPRGGQAAARPVTQIKCWDGGALVADVQLAGGKKTGFVTRFIDRRSERTSFRDGKQHGEQRTIEDGKLKALAGYENGQRVWEKEVYPDGALKKYWRQLRDGSGELARTEAGNVHRLVCAPGVRDDKELRKPCGFEGAVTTSIYDGTGKVTRVQTWKDGVLQKEGPGDSAYAARNAVAYADGKKQGEERVLREDGTVASSITWNRGVKDGPERGYSDDGKKVVKEVVWKAGEIRQVTTFFLNGNPKRREVYQGQSRRQVTEFWDTGKVSAQGAELECRSDPSYRGYHDWCEDGLHRAYFKNGAPSKEQTFKRGRREGPARGWWQSGKQESIEDWAADKLAKAKRWDVDGQLQVDEEYESDGSVKLKH